MRTNRAGMMRASESKGSLPKFEVGDYVMVAGVHEPIVFPKLVSSTWTGLSQAASHFGELHFYGVGDIVTGPRENIHVARVSPYAESLLSIATELQEVCTTLKNQGGRSTEANRCGCA